MSFSLVSLTALALLGGAATPPPSLSGTAWTLTGLTDGGRLVAPGRLAPAVTLRLDGAKIAGSTGCNLYHARFSAQGNKLRFTPLSTTRRACPDRLDGLEDRFLNLMEQVRGFERSATTLTLLAGKNDRLMFRAGGAAVDSNRTSLSGTWTVTRLVEGGQKVALVAPAELTFEPDPATGGLRLGGRAGCNRLFGPAVWSGDVLKPGPLGLTRMLCAPEQMTQEAALLRVLSGPLKVTPRAATLTLSGPSGEIELGRGD